MKLSKCMKHFRNVSDVYNKSPKYPIVVKINYLDDQIPGFNSTRIFRAQKVYSGLRKPFKVLGTSDT